MGDLRRNYWPDTLSKLHSWITANPKEYVWSFLEGFFDTRGSISLRPGRNEITPPHPVIYLSTTSRNGANTLIEMLSLVGVSDAFFHKSRNTKEGIRGVVVSNLDNVRNFADNIDSALYEKRLELARCKNRYSHKGKFTIFTDSELAKEWQELIDLLGHGPSAWELRKLHKNGRSTHTAETYARRFGSGRFLEARKTLAQMITQ